MWTKPLETLFLAKYPIFVTATLSQLKSKVDKLDIDKLAHVPVDFSKLSNVVKNDVVKKTEYNANVKILKIKDLILLT